MTATGLRRGRIACAARTALAFASVSTAAMGCSGGSGSSLPATFSAVPFEVVTSDSGAFRVEVRTAPQPPTRGANAVELTVTNTSDGAARDGLRLAVVPWMPAMNHGTSIVPTVTAQGNGKYLLTQVELFMAGRWELRTSFSGASIDHATPALDVP